MAKKIRFYNKISSTLWNTGGVSDAATDSGSLGI